MHKHTVRTLWWVWSVTIRTTVLREEQPEMSVSVCHLLHEEIYLVKEQDLWRRGGREEGGTEREGGREGGEEGE